MQAGELQSARALGQQKLLLEWNLTLGPEGEAAAL